MQVQIHQDFFSFSVSSPLADPQVGSAQVCSVPNTRSSSHRRNCVFHSVAKIVVSMNLNILDISLPSNGPYLSRNPHRQWSIHIRKPNSDGVTDSVTFRPSIRHGVYILLFEPPI